MQITGGKRECPLRRCCASERWRLVLLPQFPSFRSDTFLTMKLPFLGLLACTALAVSLSDGAALQDVLQTQKDLESSFNSWKAMSHRGYIVRKDAAEDNLGGLGTFVHPDGRTLGVCPKPTVPTTRPTSPPKHGLVKLVQKLEDMYRMLRKALHNNLCKVVHVAYAKFANHPMLTYPLIARLVGCRDPEMDGVFKLGTVILGPQPQQQVNGHSLCKFARKHLNQHAVKAAMNIASSFLLPGPVVLRQTSAPVSPSKSPLSGEAPKGGLPEFFGIGPVIVSTNPSASPARDLFHKLLAGIRSTKQHPATTEIPPSFETEPENGQPIDDIFIADETGFGHEVRGTSDDGFSVDIAIDWPEDNSTHRHHKRYPHLDPRVYTAVKIMFLIGSVVLSLVVLYTLFRALRIVFRRPRSDPDTSMLKGPADDISYCELVDERDLNQSPQDRVVKFQVDV